MTEQPFHEHSPVSISVEVHGGDIVGDILHWMSFTYNFTSYFIFIYEGEVFEYFVDMIEYDPTILTTTKFQKRNLMDICDLLQ